MSFKEFKLLIPSSMVVVHVAICLADDWPTKAAETKRQMNHVRQVSEDVPIKDVDDIVRPNMLHKATGSFHTADSSRTEREDFSQTAVQF